MADSFISKLITELTAKTTASDTDLVPIADSNGNFFKMTWQKMKQLLLGTKDISGVGDGTVTGAISELNTKLIFDVSVLHLYPIWQVQYFECFKVSGIVTINAALFCNGQISANTNYTMTSEPVKSQIVPINHNRIIGNACDSNFSNTVCANLYFDENNYLKINIPNGDCRYIAFSSVYRSL